jgi:prepilin-type N-terminal cleavage/methylation domain-containing protein
MKKSRLSSSENAFTLIEIVVAISILAVIMGVTYSSLGGIILGRMTREFQLATASTTLMPPREDAKGKQISRISLSASSDTLDNGRPGDRITFMALEGGQYLPDGGTHSGIVQITYRVEKDPENNASDAPYYLVREETPYTRPFDKAYEKTMIFPITQSLVGFDLAFYSTQDSRWTDTWTEEAPTRLPAIIRFTIEVRSPAGRIESYSTSVALRSIN